MLLIPGSLTLSRVNSASHAPCRWRGDGRAPTVCDRYHHEQYDWNRGATHRETSFLSTGKQGRGYSSLGASSGGGLQRSCGMKSIRYGNMISNRAI